MNGADLRIALQNTLPASSRADFCVGYFNLGGWKFLVPYLKATTPVLEPYRILIGMPPDSDRELRKDTLRGIPSDEDTLEDMAALLRERKVVVKISRRRQHSKFYLLYDADRPIAGFLGSSNLTSSGLTSTGESNVALDSTEYVEYATQFASWWDNPSNTEFTDKLASLIEGRMHRQYSTQDLALNVAPTQTYLGNESPNYSVPNATYTNAYTEVPYRVSPEKTFWEQKSKSALARYGIFLFAPIGIPVLVLYFLFEDEIKSKYPDSIICIVLALALFTVLLVIPSIIAYIKIFRVAISGSLLILLYMAFHVYLMLCNAGKAMLSFLRPTKR